MFWQEKQSFVKIKTVDRVKNKNFAGLFANIHLIMHNTRCAYYFL